MKTRNKNNLYIALFMFVAFILWTLMVCFVDVREIGPRQSSVGLATINEFVHGLVGVNMTLYYITDWLGLVPIGVAFSFAVLGLMQWIKRKSIARVDFGILVLGGFYIATMAAYFLFEMIVINYRPVLINGYLEASYPSSTTLLVLCVMPTAIMQLSSRIKNSILKRFVVAVIVVFIAFMALGRLISGVHWFSDIVGSLFFSTGLVMMYRFIAINTD